MSLAPGSGGGLDFDNWAPDGRTFSAHRHVGVGTNTFMFSVDGDSVEAEPWLDDEHLNHNAVFSPNSRYVAYLSNRSGRYELYIRPLRGPGGRATVSVDGAAEPVWAANGELFYRRASDYQMMVVDVSTGPELVVGPPVELFPGGQNPGGSQTARFTVSADGQRFLMSTTLLATSDTNRRSRPRVVVVQNWVEETKARVPD